MREMTCAICGMKFDAPRGRTTCGEECRKKYKYEQNKKRTPTEMRLGAIGTCSMCGATFTRKAPKQKYCSQICQTRASGKYARAKAKIVPTKCIICGADFLTSISAQARTCSKPCTLKLRSQLAKSRAADKKPYLKNDDSFCMSCPWQTGTLDTMPLGVTSWSDPIMDPMSGGFPMRTFSVPSTAREVAA